MNTTRFGEQLLTVPGVVESPSMFKDALAFWVNGKEIVHLASDSTVDIRVTKAEISRLRDRLRGHPLVRRRASGSDWVVVDIATDEGAAIALELAEVAAAVHAPPPGAIADPPPTGARLRSLRRFH